MLPSYGALSANSVEGDTGGRRLPPDGNLHLPILHRTDGVIHAPLGQLQQGRHHVQAGGGAQSVGGMG